MELWGSKELVAAYVTVGGTLIAVLLGVWLGVLLISRSELQRQRSSVVFAVMSYRFVLSRSWNRDEGKLEMFAALNAIPGLFGKHQNVMNAYRDLYAATDKDVPLKALLRSCGEIAGLPVESLADSELNSVLIPDLLREDPLHSAGSQAAITRPPSANMKGGA